MDIGNSRLKWRLRHEGGAVAQGGGNHQLEGAYPNIFSDIADRDDIEKIYVSSVVPKLEEEFSQWCKKNWQLEPIYAAVSKFCAGVANGYDDVSQMGVDRWLAVMAAYNIDKSKPCLIVDSGSACTVDSLLSNGVHLGGYIVPGIELMRSALFRDTDRVKLNSISYDEELSAGKSTQMAVSSGLRVMELSLVTFALEELFAAGGGDIRIVLTGGNGAKLANVLKKQLVKQNLFTSVSGIIVEPELVLNGLSLALESNAFREFSQ